MPADIHVHTCYSDGAYTVEEALKIAAEKNLTFMAVTDHDTVSGLGELTAKANLYGISVIAGIELSSVYEQEDVHILGYGINWQDKNLVEKLDFFRSRRLERFIEILRCLEENGFKLNAEEIEALIRRQQSLGRSHLARMLVKKGYASSVGEVFSKWLSRGRPCFKEKYQVTPFEQIRLIKEAGGIAVLAHPGDYAVMPDFKSLVDAGLDGIEVFHPDHSPAQVSRFLEIADHFKLLVSGGSDAHGPGGERGYEIGTVVLEDRYLEAILERLGL